MLVASPRKTASERSRRLLAGTALTFALSVGLSLNAFAQAGTVDPKNPGRIGDWKVYQHEYEGDHFVAANETSYGLTSLTISFSPTKHCKPVLAVVKEYQHLGPQGFTGGSLAKFQVDQRTPIKAYTRNTYFKYGPGDSSSAGLGGTYTMIYDDEDANLTRVIRQIKAGNKITTTHSGGTWLNDQILTSVFSLKGSSSAITRAENACLDGM